MGTHFIKFMIKRPYFPSVAVRFKTTSIQYVNSRARDHTFEKFMEKYKNLLKVVAIQDLILANPKHPVVSLDFLSRLSQKLHLNRGAVSFLRKYPHIFHIFYDPAKSLPFCKLTEAAIQISHQESEAIRASLPLVVDRLVRLLSMSTSKVLPLRAIFKVWRVLGLPDDFEDSVISANSHIFELCNAPEPGTHLIKLVGAVSGQCSFTTAVEDWRVEECCKDDCSIENTDIRFGFKHRYPPGMRLSKDYKAKVRKWQRLAYSGPYDKITEKKKSKADFMAREKRAVAIVHEFLSLTVEKMVEVEMISHFRKWFGIDFNIRDLFLDHPGIFYLSNKGKTHTVLLREAYERGCLIHPNLVYNTRRKLFDLVILERRRLFTGDTKLSDISGNKETELLKEGKDISDGF